MIIGDYGAPKSAQSRVAASMASEASRVSANAILALGDNIYENGATSSDQMVREWRNVYMKHSGNKRPWYVVMGNHDWRTSKNVQRDFTKSSKNEGGYWNMPSYWFSKRFDDVEVFFVDTQIWRGDVSSFRSKISEQKRWLEGALSSSSASWKIVVGHHPTYSAGNHGGASQMKRELDPIMRKHGANVYFAGHDHSQQHISHRNVNYVVSGSGAKTPRSRKNDYPSGSLKKYLGVEGFASLRICDSSSASLKMFDARGGTVYSTTLMNEMPGSPSPSPSPRPPTSPSPSDGRRRSRRRRSRRRNGAKIAEAEVEEVEEADEEVEEVEEEVEEVEGVSTDEAICHGVELHPVDMRCSSDGCTVQPDTDSSTVTCEEYCASHGLSCAGAWANEFEDCGLDTEITCQDLVMDDGAQVCKCN